MTRHNHLTRDIKPVGICPQCDRSWASVIVPGTEFGRMTSMAGVGTVDERRAAVDRTIERAR